MADRICLMRDGAIVLDGDPERVWRQPVDAFSAAFFGDCSILPATCQGGVARIGGLVVPAPGLDDGPVQVVVRHASLRLTTVAPEQAMGVVVDHRFLGGRRLSVVRIEDAAGRHLLTARHDEDQRFAIGDTVRCGIAPGGALCFPTA